MKQDFYVGCCKRQITPPLGTPLYGYPRERRAQAVHDDLYVNAAVFGSGKPEAALIGMDLCALRVDLTDRISKAITQTVQIPADRIIICAIHTHSGPCTTTTPGWGDSNSDYIDQILIPQTVSAVQEAAAGMQPAKMGVGTTESRVGINRRQIMPDGSVILGQNPYGCFDPEMTVLAFADSEKKPLLNIVHYGAHATAAGGNLEITRDWPGFMVDRLEAETGAMSFFINGAEGDVGPRLSNGKTTGSLSHAAEVGGIAAIDAMRAYNSIREFRDVQFRTITGTLNIPYYAFPSREEITKEIALLEQKKLSGINEEHKGIDEELKGIHKIKYTVLQERLRILDSGEPIQTQAAMQQVLFAFNSTVLVPFGFEVFSEITVRLRQYSPFVHTLSLCNANGALAYLPSREQLTRGGYEILQFINRHVYRMVDNTDDIIINENLRLLQKLEAAPADCDAHLTEHA